MRGRLYIGEGKYNIIIESFNNPNITITEICRNHGILYHYSINGRSSSLKVEKWKAGTILMKYVESLKAIIGQMPLANKIFKSYTRRKRQVQWKE